MFVVYFLLVVLPLVSAQVEVLGPCPVPDVQSDFNINAYLGMWYEVSSIPSPFSRGKCITAEYKMGKGGFFTAENSNIINGKRFSQAATVKVRQSGEKAKLEIQFSESQPFLPYWVLNTDYQTYAVVYSCENYYDTHYQFAWILSRKPYLNPKTLHDAKSFLVNQKIYGNMMEDMDQSCYSRSHS